MYDYHTSKPFCYEFRNLVSPVVAAAAVVVRYSAGQEILCFYGIPRFITMQKLTIVPCP